MADLRTEPFVRLFRESREVLRRYVRRFVRSKEAADEIVQEAFLRTYNQRQSIHAPRAFLFSTAHNLALKSRRHERAAATDTVGDFENLHLANHYPPVEDGLIAEEASQLLKEAVECLPPQCRAAFSLKVFHACSYREIAERLGLAEKTVEKHIARGLRETHVYLRRRYAISEGSAEPSSDTANATTGVSTNHRTDDERGGLDTGESHG